MPGLFLSATSFKASVTAWIIPLLSMLEQFLQRCAQLNIPCQVWNSAMPISAAPSNLLIVLETTESDALRQFFKTLSQSQRLAQIIVDEAHLIIGHAFRDVVHTLSWIGGLGVPVTLQSATIPPSMEAHLFSMFGITAWRVFREPTMRANTSYQVEQIPDIDVRLSQLIRGKQNGKMLIFCTSQWQVEALAVRFGIPGVWSLLGQERIDSVLAQLRTGEVTVVVSTPLLGVALHVPAVDIVVHYGCPFDMLGYIQETGRAGRSRGAYATAITLISPTQQDHAPQHPDYMGRALMKHFVESRLHCRRWAIGVFNDGVGQTCSTLTGEAHLCDICQSHANSRVLTRYDDGLIARFLPRQ